MNVTTLYEKLSKNPVFSLQDAYQFYDHNETARSAVNRLLHIGMVQRIRKNMYTCKDEETGQPIADKYQIACAIHPDSYLTHHTAMEYYALDHKKCCEIYVSGTSFRGFSFGGYNYHYVPSKNSSDVKKVKNSGGVRVTTLERTVVDSIKDMDKIAGVEEVIANIGKITNLKEKGILRNLETYDNQFLYQKTGFLLHPFRDRLGLSDSFFEACKSKIGLSRRYLSNDYHEGKYDSTWQIIAPSDILV